MRYFVCLLDTNGHGIAREAKAHCEVLARRRGLRCEWRCAPGAAVLTASDDAWDNRSLVAQHGAWLAAGSVRLDNRREVEGWMDVASSGLTDLELTLLMVARYGASKIKELLGDFGFVAWDTSTRSGVAACDAFAVRRVYYAQSDDGLAFASRADVLTRNERYEPEYLARLVSLNSPPAGQTAFSDVRTLPAAHLALLETQRVRVSEYWRPTVFDVCYGWNAQDAAYACRQLLVESIRCRIGSGCETWAQLSGGLDSSTIVSLAQWLAERGEIPYGLAGAVTHVDRQASGADEREYSSEVASHWRIRNVVVVDPPTWYEPACPPPQLDQPSLDFSAHPRDRRMVDSIRAEGGRILLTGWGGDELFAGSMLFFADRILDTDPWSVLREMLQRAAAGRVSFWHLAYKNVLVPLLPRRVRNWAIDDELPAQSWLAPTVKRQYGLSRTGTIAEEYAGAWHRKYQHAVATRVRGVSQLTAPTFITESLDVRHPMLYRPLVEFALRLPPELRARPHAHRWVLRESVRGILPEKVRTRVGKPGTGAALAGSLATAWHELAALLEAPVLGELGLVDVDKLRAAFNAALNTTAGHQYSHTALVSTLAVEAWLQIRSGRWPRGGPRRW